MTDNILLLTSDCHVTLKQRFHKNSFFIIFNIYFIKFFVEEFLVCNRSYEYISCLTGYVF